jgi:Phasin protein
MASTETRNSTPTVEAAFEQVKDLNGQFLGAARQAGMLYLDAYEKAVEQTIELQLKVAGVTEQEWLKDLIEKQADFAREVTSSYTSIVRSLLK